MELCIAVFLPEGPLDDAYRAQRLEVRLLPSPTTAVRCIWVIGLPGSNPGRGPTHASAVPITPFARLPYEPKRVAPARSPLFARYDDLGEPTVWLHWSSCSRGRRCPTRSCDVCPLVALLLGRK